MDKEEIISDLREIGIVDLTCSFEDYADYIETELKKAEARGRLDASNRFLDKKIPLFGNYIIPVSKEFIAEINQAQKELEEKPKSNIKKIFGAMPDLPDDFEENKGGVK